MYDSSIMYDSLIIHDSLIMYDLFQNTKNWLKIVWLSRNHIMNRIIIISRQHLHSYFSIYMVCASQNSQT